MEDYPLTRLKPFCFSNPNGFTKHLQDVSNYNTLSSRNNFSTPSRTTYTGTEWGHKKTGSYQRGKKMKKKTSVSKMWNIWNPQILLVGVLAGTTTG